jgi:hypothetical protein
MTRRPRTSKKINYQSVVVWYRGNQSLQQSKWLLAVFEWHPTFIGKSRSLNVGPEIAWMNR